MYENIFGEKFLRNPNLIDVELLEAELKTIKYLITDYAENKAIPDENIVLFKPLLAKINEALSPENKKKSYEKSLIGAENE